MKQYISILIALVAALQVRTNVALAQPQQHEQLVLRQLKLTAPSVQPVSLFKPMRGVLSGKYTKCTVAYLLEKSKNTDNPIQISEAYLFDKNGHVCQSNKLIVQLKDKKRDTIRSEFEGQIANIKGEPILFKKVDYLAKTANYQIDIDRDTAANISKIIEKSGRKTVYDYFYAPHSRLDSFHINTFIDDDFSLFQAVYCQKKADTLLNLQVSPPRNAGLPFTNMIYIARDTTVQLFQFKEGELIDTKNAEPSKIWRYNKKRQVVIIIDKATENEDRRYKFEYDTAGVLRRTAAYRFGNLVLEQLFNEKGFLIQESTPEEGAKRVYEYDSLTNLVVSAELYSNQKKKGIIKYFFSNW